MALPPPPPNLDPLIAELPAGSVLYRVHALRRDPAEFNPGVGAPSRFAPLEAGDPRKPVPTLYASSTIQGALSESAFHDVPFRGPAKRILISRLHGSALSPLALNTPLQLVQLAGPGLRRLGVKRRQIIEGGPRTYARTTEWAAALHDSASAPAGLTWMSRQDDTARAYVLFGDRVDSRELIALSGPMPLDVSPGLDFVEQAAVEAGITVVR